MRTSSNIVTIFGMKFHRMYKNFTGRVTLIVFLERSASTGIFCPINRTKDSLEPSFLQPNPDLFLVLARVGYRIGLVFSV